jgi:O-antigen ligase
VLVETGILGLVAFLYLLFSIFKVSLHNLKEIKTPYFQGLAIGFFAGFVGLVVHALGANTFIIVRIMEPFWFFAGIMVVMPAMEREQAEQTQKVALGGKALASGS